MHSFEEKAHAALKKGRSLFWNQRLERGLKTTPTRLNIDLYYAKNLLKLMFHMAHDNRLFVFSQKKIFFMRLFPHGTFPPASPSSYKTKK